MPMNARLRPMVRTVVAALALATGAMIVPAPAGAARRSVGKAVPEAFSFVPLDIGMRKGSSPSTGSRSVDRVAGDARMQQAMASDSLDIALGSGPAMAFIVKGSPIKGVAAMAGPPLLLAIVVRPDGPKSASELKGKKISVSTAGSLTYWLVSETSRRQGWGPKGIDIAPMGAMPGQIAAIKRGDIDGAIMDIGNALLEKRGEGRILVRFTDIKDFHIHVIFAADKLIAGRPEAVRAFLQGWFETIAFMRTNKETVAIAKEVTNKDEEITARVYDELMPMFSDDGIQPERARHARQVLRGAAGWRSSIPPSCIPRRSCRSGCAARRAPPGSRAVRTRHRGDWIFGGVTHQLLASSPVSACCRIEAIALIPLVLNN